MPFLSTNLGEIPHEGLPEVAYYTDEMVVHHLTHPAGSTDVRVFESALHPPGIRGNSAFKDRWSLPPLTEERVSLDYSPARKAYDGPIYFQGYGIPTCESWATIHSLLVAGVRPSVPLTKSLLNASLAEESGENGIELVTAGEIVRQHISGVIFDSFRESVTAPNVQQLASYVKTAVDAEGAAIATIMVNRTDGTPASHAICVAGYNIDNRGYMDLQVIDAACGAGTVNIENLKGKLHINSTAPLATVTKETLGNPLGWAALYMKNI